MLGNIQISIIDATHGWQALASVTVMDEDGNPVSDTKVVGVKNGGGIMNGYSSPDLPA